MSISETRQDAIHRVQDPRRDRGNYPAYVLRSMNRVYHRLNARNDFLRKVLVVDFASRDDHTAVVDGAQADVNQITVDSGHDVVTGDVVYCSAWAGSRTVTAYTSTTITISGLPITVKDEDDIETLGNKWPLPADFRAVSRIGPMNSDTPKVVYQDPSLFYEGAGQYTISFGHLHFGSVTADTQYEIWYWSSGFELVDVDTGDLTAGQANAPEWEFNGADDLLFYATCLEIAADYPMRAQDERNYKDLLNALQEMSYHLQDQTPDVVGGRGVYQAIDTYEKPGYENQDT